MKELSIEQKARRYDEAIERANNLHKDAVEMENNMTTKTCEIIFPELKESEDERIRKLLVEAVTQVLQDQYCSNRGVSKEKVIAWLEKQGEQNKQEKDIILCHLWHNEREKCLDKKAYILFHSTYDNTWNVFTACTINWNVVDKWAYLSDIINIVNKDSKQSEQNPAWSKEDEDYYDAIIAKLEVTQEDALLTDNQMNFLKSLKDKYVPQSKIEWSEEDKNMLQSILDEYKSMPTEKRNWLKSLKDRVQPQPVWSKEDEEMLRKCISATFDHGYLKECNWLKSKSQWKPSNEHYELEEFAKIVRCNLTGISKAVQELFEAKYLQLTGNKMYEGFKD